MHYETAAEAKNKWDRRKKRIDPDNLIFAFTDKDLCTPALLEEFDALPYANKYVLTAKKWPQLKSTVQVPYFEDEDEIGDCYTHYGHLSHIAFDKLVPDKSSRSEKQRVSYVKQGEVEA